jgi:hypothetical protein
LATDALIIQLSGVILPNHKARTHRLDLKAQNIRRADWALASLAVLARLEKAIRTEMLEAAITLKFKGKTLTSSLDLIRRVEIGEAV